MSIYNDHESGSPGLRSGDLAEEFMEEVEEIARELDDGSVPFEDLIQEGYVGLLEGIDLVESAMERDSASAAPLAETIRTAIKSSIRLAIKRGSDSYITDDRLVAQVELLNKSIDRLTEELGNKPNIDEIANDMGISQEKVLSILKLTGGVSDDAAFTGGK